MTRRNEEPIIEVENLTKYFSTSEGFIEDFLGRSQQIKAVDGVNFELYEGETLGVVGESGCGKTTLGRAMLRLIEPTSGNVFYRGENLMDLSSSKLRDTRKDLQYIFQDPFSSLNPRLTIGDIIGEPLDIHDIASGTDRRDRVQDLLEIVGLNPSHTNRYPHEFSGGQRQRLGIARALAVDPEVIVCDEPVSALDVSVQAQILNLLEDLQSEFGLSYIFIAHDLSVVEHISDRVAVMYLGEFAEVGTTQEVYGPPYHPYTEALLSAIPEPDPRWDGDQILLSGQVPSPINPPDGCRFHTRCPRVIQPSEYDVDQSVWRALQDLTQRLTAAETITAVTAYIQEEEAEHTNPEDLTTAEIDSLVRKEFGLPDSIRDRDLARAFGDIVDHLTRGDLEGAREQAIEAFHTPCEEADPELLAADGTHRIACHLYDPDHPGEEPEFVAGAAGNAAADD